MILYNSIQTYGLFGSLEREESSEEESRGEWLSSTLFPPPCLDVFKISRGNGVISHFSYLDVLKIRIEMRENDLNRQNLPLFENGLVTLVND